MQSLVLATSLLLSSQSPVIATDVAQEVESFVQSETNRVSQLVQQRQQGELRVLLLHPTNLIVKKDTFNQSSTTETAE